MDQPREPRRQRRPRQPTQPTEASAPPLLAPRSAEVQEALLDLAYDVSSRLRQHSRPAIRISAALLLAASLAACSGGGPAANTADASAIPAEVAPLRQEVRSGLPTAVGRYPLVSDSLTRDQQGVYRFSWLRPGESGAGNPAQASLVRLAENSTEFLEIPAQGDPILNLRHNSVVRVASLPGTPTTVSAGSVGSSGSYGYWRPFYGGSTYYGPAYYEPPVRYMPTSGGTIDGARGSTAPVPAAQRTIGLAHAVSGRAGGTGSGTAATNRSGADVGSVGGKSSVAAPKSSGFSSGGAATAKGGGSSGASSS